MRMTRWAQKFNLTVIPCEDRPDRPQGDHVYRIVDIFTTRDSSWEPSDTPGSVEPWAREAYLRPSGAPDYFDDAGADHHLFARILDAEGRPVTTERLVRYWSDGLAQLGNPDYQGYTRETPKERSGWANIPIWSGSHFNPEAGGRGPWCWCPEGASDVVVGGGMPHNWHVSTFVVWQLQPRQGQTQPPDAPVDEPPLEPPDEPPDRPAVEPPDAAALRTEAWGALGLVYQPESPLARYAGQQRLGAPLSAEFTSGAYRIQAYALAVVYAATDAPDRVSHISWHAASGNQLVSPDVPDVPDNPVVPDHPDVPDIPTIGRPTPTRPPTVTLSPENIAHLRTFPRPPQDNGFGLHFRIGLTEESIAWTVERLKSIHARWTLIYAQDELQAEAAARATWAAGIMPCTRIGKRIDEGFDPEPYVTALKRVDAPPYIQIFNEPGDTREWRKDALPPGWLGTFGINWARMAARVVDAGGYPGLQVLERNELDAAIDAVAAIGRPDIWDRAWFSLHNYGANHPPAYPYDLGLTVFDDFYGVLSLLAFARWMQERIGFVLPIIGGEGGWQYGQDQDRRYPKVDNTGPVKYHADYHREMFSWFRTGLLSNGELLPDYLFSVAPWIAGGWGADDWWGGVLGTKTDTVEAIAGIPPFVRRFSWDG